MKRAWWLSLVLPVLGGCVRAVLPSDDGGVPVGPAPDPVRVEGVSVLARPEAAEPNEDGGTTLHVFVGDVLLITGSGWEPGAAQVTVGSVPLAVEEGSTATLLRVRVQGALPHGAVRVGMGTRAGESGEVVASSGLGHVAALQDRGTLEAQLAVGNAGTLQPCTRGQQWLTGIPSQPLLDDGGMPVLDDAGQLQFPEMPVAPCVGDEMAAGLALGFTLGLGEDADQPVYLASVMQQNGPWGRSTVLGRVPPLPADVTTVRRRRLDGLRPYQRSAQDGVVHVVGIEKVDHGTPDNPLAMSRLVTDLGASDPMENLWGPIFPLEHNGVTTFLALRDDWPTSLGAVTRVVWFTEDADARHLRHAVLAPDLPTSAPVAVGLVHNTWLGGLLSPPAAETTTAPSLLVLSCRGLEDPTLNLDILQVDPGPHLGMPRHFNVPAQTCALDLCMQASRSGNLVATPREIQPLDSETFLVMPGLPESYLDDTTEAPCVISTAHTASVEACHGSPCVVGQAVGNLRAAQGTVVRGAESGGAYWGVTSNPGRDLAWADGLVGVVDDARATAVQVHSVASPLQVSALAADGASQALYAVPPWGGHVFTLDPAGNPTSVLGVLGAPLGAWPLSSQQRILAVHEHAVMAMDINGYPRPFVPQVDAPFTGAVADLGPRGQVLGVLVGSHNAQGHAVVLRFDTGNLTTPQLVFVDDVAGTMLRPVRAHGNLLVAERSVLKAVDPAAIDPCGFDGTMAGSEGGSSAGPSQPVAPHHLVLLTRADGAPATLTVLPGTCDAQALVLDGQRLWANRPLLNTYPPTPQGFVMNVAMPTADHRILDAVPINLLPLPGGAVLGVAYRLDPEGFSVACFPPDGARVDLGPPPMLDGTWAQSPDHTRLYAGTSGALLELSLAPLDPLTGCPPPASDENPAPVAVVRRIGLPGTPQSLALDASGERLLWVDGSSEQVGVVE